jgi:hypothetical protein
MHQQTPAVSGLAIQVRIPKDLVSAIEGFRRNQPDIPTRPEAIRRLIRRAIATDSQA